METNNKYLGITNLITFNEFANMNIDKHLEVILPSIESVNYNKDSQTTENTENTQIESMYKLSNLAVFKENKLLGYLSQDESLTVITPMYLGDTKKKKAHERCAFS